MLANTTIITPTYQFIDTLTHHIFVQVKDHQRTPDVSLWPGEGIYDIAIINENQLILVFPTLKMADGSLLNVPEYQILQLTPPIPYRIIHDRYIRYTSSGVVLETLRRSAHG
jgi:hypothetical protein